MREKKRQCVVTFHTTTEAMAFEQVAKDNGLKGRLIPLPRVIGAGCGLSWKEEPEYQQAIEDLINNHNLGYAQIYDVMI